MQSNKMPIGYWIKQADELLTRGIDDIHSSFGITRTGWQILNSINEKEFIMRVDLTNLIKPFADANNVKGILTKFKAEHLVNEDEEKLTLTDKGIKLYKTCFEQQKIFRQKVMSGISEQDYEIAILTLQKMVANLTNESPQY